MNSTAPEPTIVAQAGSLVVSVVRHVAAGLPQADADTLARRLALCQECGHRAPAGRCNQCGCLISIKAKWAGEKCPLGKW